MGFAGIDIIFLVLIGISFLRCAVRGFISELLSMAALILGLLFAIFFFKNGAHLIREWFMPNVKVVPEIIAFVALFIVIYIMVKVIEITLKNIIEGIRLGGLDRLLGALFGIIEGIVVVCLILFLLSIQPFFNSEPILEKSIFATFLLPFIFGEKKEVVETLEALVVMGLFNKENKPHAQVCTAKPCMMNKLARRGAKQRLTLPIMREGFSLSSAPCTRRNTEVIFFFLRGLRGKILIGRVRGV
jgi:membrane protein required for colicin V production